MSCRGGLLETQPNLEQVAHDPADGPELHCDLAGVFVGWLSPLLPLVVFLAAQMVSLVAVLAAEVGVVVAVCLARR